MAWGRWVTKWTDERRGAVRVGVADEPGRVAPRKRTLRSRARGNTGGFDEPPCRLSVCTCILGMPLIDCAFGSASLALLPLAVDGWWSIMSETKQAEVIFHCPTYWCLVACTAYRELVVYARLPTQPLALGDLTLLPPRIPGKHVVCMKVTCFLGAAGRSTEAGRDGLLSRH